MTVDAASESRLEAAQAGLAAAREIAATGPAAGEAGMRTAYLELLKLSLCDLVGASTTSVGRSPQGEVWARDVADDGRRIRAAGMDWPAHGLTMVGLRRLDDLQACVESVVSEAIEGDLIEAGSWRGGASLLMRATLDALGDHARTVWVADSFAGFPVDEAPVDGDAVSLAVIDFLSVPLDEVKTSFARLGLERGVRFLPGFFADTLPALPRDARFSLVRLDADTYETTRLALDCLYPRLSVGGYLVVDDYGAVEECAAAVDDFRREHQIDEALKRIDWTGVRWRSERQLSLAAAPGGTTGPPPRAADRGGRRRVPTLEEVGLRDELEALRARVAQLESELAQADSLRARIRSWLGR